MTAMIRGSATTQGPELVTLSCCCRRRCVNYEVVHSIAFPCQLPSPGIEEASAARKECDISVAIRVIAVIARKAIPHVFKASDLDSW